MNYELSRTEQEIMELLWANNRPMKTCEIMDYFTDMGKGWKRQTLNTLLLRLEEKGVVKRRRGIVEAAYSRDEMTTIECKDIVNSRFGNKLSNFVTAFTGGECLNKEEADELIELINHLKEK